MNCNMDCKNCSKHAITTVDNMELHKKAMIVVVGGEGALRRRLLDMGLTPKTIIEVNKVAPLGDPLELKLRGYLLSIRKDDAKKIEVCYV